MLHSAEPWMFDEDAARQKIDRFFARPDIIDEFEQLEESIDDILKGPFWDDFLNEKRRSLDRKFGCAIGLQLQNAIGEGRFASMPVSEYFERPVAFGAHGSSRTEMVVVHNYWTYVPKPRGITVIPLPNSTYYPRATRAFALFPSLLQPTNAELRTMRREMAGASV